MTIYKYRNFHLWAKSENLTDEMLTQAVDEMKNGLFDVNLGGGLYKKRVAMQGKGKSGGFRTLIAFKHEKAAFFIYGFAKNVRENITEKEKEVYKKLSKYYLNTTDVQMSILVKNGELVEVS